MRSKYVALSEKSFFDLCLRGVSMGYAFSFTRCRWLRSDHVIAVEGFYGLVGVFLRRMIGQCGQERCKQHEKVSKMLYDGLNCTVNDSKEICRCESALSLVISVYRKLIDNCFRAKNMLSDDEFHTA